MCQNRGQPSATGEWRAEGSFQLEEQERLSGAIQDSSGKRWRDVSKSIHGRRKNRALVLYLVSRPHPSYLSSIIYQLPWTSHQVCWHMLTCSHFHEFTAVSFAQVQGTMDIESIWKAGNPWSTTTVLCQGFCTCCSFSLSISFPLPFSSSLPSCVSHYLPLILGLNLMVIPPLPDPQVFPDAFLDAPTAPCTFPVATLPTL